MSDLQKILRREFPADKVQGKKGRGGMVMKYISHGLVTERLNEADPTWSTRMISEHIFYDDLKRPHCAGVTIELTINDPEKGVSATRVETGGPQNLTGYDPKFPYNFADEIKNAYSDALKRAAMRFGVALSMWEELIDSQGDEDVYPELVGQPDRVEAAKHIFDGEPIQDQMDAHNAQVDANRRNANPYVEGIKSAPAVAQAVNNGTAEGPTEKQTKMIHAIRRNLDMSEEQLYQLAGVDSLSKLSRSGVSDVITKLKALQGDEEAISWVEFYHKTEPYGITGAASFKEKTGKFVPGTLAEAKQIVNDWVRSSKS